MAWLFRMERYVATLEELQERVKQADSLLAKDLLPEDRLRVAKLRLLDQVAILLRRKMAQLQPERRRP
jgi:hypothetical protein